MIRGTLEKNVSFFKLTNYDTAKANAEQTSVRSHSPDIGEDINKEIAETGMRLANMHAVSSRADNSIDSNTMMKEG